MPPESPPSRSWHRLVLAGRPRFTKANALATVLAVLLGVAIAVTVRQTSLQGLETLRADELARILDTVDQDGQRLDIEAQRLRTSRDLLTSSTTSNSEAQRAAQERLDALGILTGTAAATGPGITLRIEDAAGKVTAPALLDAISELRDAGAEAIQIGEVRVVASTWFAGDPGRLTVSGTPLSTPYVLRVIGDPHTLATALAIPGGVTSQMRGLGATTAVEESDGITITALHTLSPPQYAQPVPTTSSTQGAP